MAPSTLMHPDPTLFQDHVTQVVTRLQRAVAAVLESVGQSPGARPVQIAEQFNIDNKLGWKVSRLVTGADPFAAAQYVPGTAAFRMFLRAAKRLEVSTALVASADAAFQSFCELVHTHAGSRKAFDMMLAAHAEQDRGRADLEHRRQMFEGSSYVWGVQTRVAFRADVLAPSADPNMFDCATVRGFVDLRRLRPHVPWRIGRGYSADDAGDAHTSFVRVPLDPHPQAEKNHDGPPLMRRFCSQPLPQCRRVEGPQGVIEYELIEGAVGNTGVLTCITGEILRCAEPRYRSDLYHDISQMLHLRTPSELVIFDVMIHRELFGGRISPELIVYSDLFVDRIAPRYRECDRLPVQEELQYLGMGLDVLQAPEIPHYREIVTCAIERGGWKPDQFDAFRVQMRYPPLPATLTIAHDLPDAPGDAPQS